MVTTKKKIKVIIFGATGSIGSYLAKEYISQNNEVLLFVKNIKSKKKILKKLKFYLLKKKIKINKLNIKKLSLIKKKLNKHKSFIKNTNIIINATGGLGEIKNILKINLKNLKIQWI